MSYMNARNGTYGNFTNGTGDRDSQIRRFEFETSSRETSADERSRSRDPNTYGRAGGYGGFGSRLGGSGAGLDRTQARRRSRAAEDEWSASSSRSRPGFVAAGGRAGGQVEEILRYIEQQWSFMASPTCIPVKTALQLMDPSSLGLADQYDQFQQTHTQLQNGLKVIVNEHHQGFNSSIGTFHKIQAAIHASQQRVRTLRAGLLQAKSALGTGGGGKPELRALAQSSQQHDTWLGVVGMIEQVQLVPERLEAQISEKRFLGAVDTLKEALKLIRKPEMEEIGALSDLRVYLSNQEHSLTDILVEELHSHLYLKSPYCEERWKSHTRRGPAATSAGLSDPAERSMHLFLDIYDASTPMQEDTTRNPEADTFYYIQLLIESLNKMGKLDVAVDSIEHRLPVELFRVVERSHAEVEQRHPSSMRTGTSKSRRADHFGLSESPEGEKKATLEDLLITLYAKFEAIAEGHRVLHEVTGAILKREGALDQSDAAALNRSFKELWKLLQSEIRSLLHDHLATGHMGFRSRKDDNAIGSNIFRPNARDRSKKLFKLADTDRATANSDLATEKEDLEFILKASVPGLVNTNTQNGRKDREKEEDELDRSATGHKLLVEPSVFNMGILLPPSLDFLTRLKDVVPPGSGVVASTLTSFLDDFLINVFYPQLDETLLDLCGRSMNDLDAFASHPSWQLHASRPVFKGCVRFFDQIEAFCKMLDTLPHEQSFSQLVITQMRAYYDRCYSWSKGLLQRAQMASETQQPVKMRLSADLATSGDVNETVIAVLKASQSGSNSDLELAEEEAELLLDLVKTRKLEEADLINDRKALAALCTLHTSMKWLASQCRQLRFVSPRAVDSQNSHPHHNRRWTETQNPNAGSGLPTSVYLPLDNQTANQFDAVISSFSELGLLILRTLHIDLRLHILHGISAALNTTYALEQPYNDPDPAILSLTGSLSSYDSQLATHLPQQQYAFLTTNLHVLVNAALTNAEMVGLVKGMDTYGNARMRLNVLVLQQCLKGLQSSDGAEISPKEGVPAVTDTASLERAAKFYELGERGPAIIVAKGKQFDFDTEALKRLVRLSFQQDRDGGIGGVEDYVRRLD